MTSAEANAAAFIDDSSTARLALRAAAQQHVEWQGFAFTVPGDWEIVRHGLSPALGSLRFVDRRRERLCLSWAAIKSSPDLGRMLEEMTAGEGGALRAFELGAWRGVVQRADSGTQTRAVAYHAPTSRLLELRISSPPDDTEPAAAILRSFRARDSSAEGWRYRVFGLDVVTPGDFVLKSAPVKPCDVVLCFERPANGREVPRLRFSARRLGMASSWFQGDYARLLAAKAEGVEFEELEQVSLDGHDARAARGRCVEKRWVRLLGRGREERALLWSARDENAIYLLRSEGPDGAALDPRAFVPARPARGEELDDAE